MFVHWMMSGFVTTIPREIEDAALVDGCNRFQVLRQIVLPLILFIGLQRFLVKGLTAGAVKG